jgi:hypothetical protein
MTTLISAGNSGGTYGRCDAKCYEAAGGDCHCICGGMNHGQGLAEATRLTSNMAAEKIRSIEAAGGYVAPELLQRALEV